MLTIAAGVTFYGILAIFPAIAALVSIYGLFADPATISSHLDNLAGIAPSGAIDVIGDQMKRIAASGKSTLGLTFAFGLLVSLWSANAGVKSMFDALNLVYNEEEKRGLIGLNLMSLAFTGFAIVFALVAMAAIVVLPAFFAHLGLSGAINLFFKIGRWPIMFVLVALALAILYRFGPSRSRPQWRWISWGSAFAAVTWIAASIPFSWYTANFGSYNNLTKSHCARGLAGAREEFQVLRISVLDGRVAYRFRIPQPNQGVGGEMAVSVRRVTVWVDDG